MASVRHKIKQFADDSLERYLHRLARKSMKKKFQDTRRKKIYSSVTLSKSQMQEIDRIFLENYGEKIPYTWHKHYTAYTGHFDAMYFPELLDIPEFQHYMNPYKAYSHVLSDKNFLAVLCSGSGLHCPKTLLSATYGVYRDAEFRMISREETERMISDLGESFIKPSVNTGSGIGCRLLDMRRGIDKQTGKTARQILEYYGENFIIQERIKCHRSISAIYPHAVNTFRIISYRWKDEICHGPVLMRIGRGGQNVDNVHAGGIFIALEDDGTMHDKAYTEFGEEYRKHPDTGFVFEGQKIDGIPKVLEAVKRFHELVPQIGCMHMDFTIDEGGCPTLIEINVGSGGSGSTMMAHGKGLFGEKTGEILRWLRLMKHTPKHLQHNYYFGKGMK